MPIITKAEFDTVVKAKLSPNQTVLTEARNAQRDSPDGKEVTIFLSHSHEDKDEIYLLVTFLRKLGIRVYVDWMDEGMPPVTSGATARRIKEKIMENRKFILLATNKAVDSKWCNWELGFGDAKKYIEHISLFPLADYSGHWKGQEYLQIYPRIEKSQYTDQWYIIYPDQTQKRLEDWLRS